MSDTFDRTEDADLELPDLGDGDDREGVEEDSPEDLEMADDGGDPLDDSLAADLPLDIEIHTGDEEPTVVGDDADGIDGAADDDDAFDEDGDSLLDDGAPDATWDEDLGIEGEEQAPRTGSLSPADDGGAEGVEDPTGELIDDLPPLDGDEKDDAAEELDLGLDLQAPPPTEEADED